MVGFRAKAHSGLSQATGRGAMGSFAGAFIGVDPNWAITVKKCVPAKGEFDLLLMVVKAIQPTLN